MSLRSPPKTVKNSACFLLPLHVDSFAFFLLTVLWNNYHVNLDQDGHFKEKKKGSTISFTSLSHTGSKKGSKSRSAVVRARLSLSLVASQQILEHPSWIVERGNASPSWGCSQVRIHKKSMSGCPACINKKQVWFIWEVTDVLKCLFNVHEKPNCWMAN